MNEADKVNEQHGVNPAKFNQATDSAPVEINPKGEKSRQILLRGTLVVLAGGPLGREDKDGNFEPFPWDAQGILPDERGYGGRFHDAHHFTNQPIDKAYGHFIHAPTPPQEQQRQILINTLGHWLLNLDEVWPQEFEPQARQDLQDFVDLHGARTAATPESSAPAWQKCLAEAMEEREGAKESRDDIEDYLYNVGVEPPPTNQPSLKKFMRARFGSENKRIQSKTFYLNVGFKADE